MPLIININKPTYVIFKHVIDQKLLDLLNKLNYLPSMFRLHPILN